MQESLTGSKLLSYFAYVTVYVCLLRSASRHCCLQGSRSAQRYHCIHRLTWYKYSYTVGGSNNERLTNVGTNEVVPVLSALISLSSLLPLESSSVWRCHCTVPSLISSSLHPTFLPRDHTHACAAVDCIPERYRQNRDSTPHCMIICLTSHSAIKHIDWFIVKWLAT